MMIFSDSSKYTHFSAEENEKQLIGPDYLMQVEWEHIYINLIFSNVFTHHLLNTYAALGTLLGAGR